MPLMRRVHILNPVHAVASRGSSTLRITIPKPELVMGGNSTSIIGNGAGPAALSSSPTLLNHRGRSSDMIVLESCTELGFTPK